MYHRRKIGVFISHIYGDFQTRLCTGILRRAAEYGYLVEIFASNDGEDLGDYSLGERGILEIPRSGGYDGFILASGTYLLPSLVQEITELLKQNFHCPVVDINQTASAFPNVFLENNSPIKELVYHLHQVHGYRQLFYLGNTTEPLFDTQRERYFLEGLAQLALPSDNHVFSCDGTPDGLAPVLDAMLAQSPQAIVCYNDALALEVISALQARGMRVPGDIAVTGVDTLDFGQHTSPVLTSVTFPIDRLGEKAIDLLSASYRGEEIPAGTEILASPAIGSSCGCPCADKPEETYAYSRELQKRIDRREADFILSMHMSANLQGIDDLDQGMDLLEAFVGRLPHCREFYLCLYDGWDIPSSHIRRLTHTDSGDRNAETVLLKLAVKDGKRLPECTFTRHNPLPDYLYGRRSSYIYSPLFFEEQQFGYLALSFEDGTIGYDFAFLSWLMNVNHMLKNLWDKKTKGLLVNRLEELYTRDALTGLVNRNGFRQAAEDLFARAVAVGMRVCAITLDLDCLKQINDRFGHPEGDFAIRVLARALENAVEAPAVCTRLDGGEFQILVPDCDAQRASQLLDNIRKYLEHYNRLRSKNYLIHASGGVCSRIPGRLSELSEMFREAEQAMHDAKKANENHMTKG